MVGAIQKLKLLTKPPSSVIASLILISSLPLHFLNSAIGPINTALLALPSPDGAKDLLGWIGVRRTKHGSEIERQTYNMAKCQNRKTANRLPVTSNGRNSRRRRTTRLIIPLLPLPLQLPHLP